ncbi:histidine phosphatase family protein [Actinoallomurus rhizosphaericola]|uniref:histidine phosphatase family protein n=1 Tax=Actinoallomurus rhizosphaericola TaxID=2952536 RepID=UPI002091A179|nr:histidine phosphatase family protein [Actinoallomurus rhizosphaericola]MCO5993843.1 histidine phosphatase family protein [Actinoallomurus rhizosphaericola]
MTEARKIVLWRHGQTSWNVERRFQGSTDIPLDDTGREQAARAARLLAALRPSAIIASPLQRAAHTAQALSTVTGLPVTADRDLIERGGGEWEGLTNAEIRAKYPTEHALWQPPGGETTEQVAKRVTAAFERGLTRIPAGGLLVVASHGAALRLGMLRWLGFPEELWGRFGGLSNCCWSVLEEGRSGWRLAEHNAGTLPEPVLSDDRAAEGDA